MHDQYTKYGKIQGSKFSYHRQLGRCAYYFQVKPVTTEYNTKLIEKISTMGIIDRRYNVLSNTLPLAVPIKNLKYCLTM